MNNCKNRNILVDNTKIDNKDIKFYSISPPINIDEYKGKQKYIFEMQSIDKKAKRRNNLAFKLDAITCIISSVMSALGTLVFLIMAIVNIKEDLFISIVYFVFFALSFSIYMPIFAIQLFSITFNKSHATVPFGIIVDSINYIEEQKFNKKILSEKSSKNIDSDQTSINSKTPLNSIAKTIDIFLFVSFVIALQIPSYAISLSFMRLLSIMCCPICAFPYIRQTILALGICLVVSTLITTCIAFPIFSILFSYGKTPAILVAKYIGRWEEYNNNDNKNTISDTNTKSCKISEVTMEDQISERNQNSDDTKTQSNQEEHDLEI